MTRLKSGEREFLAQLSPAELTSRPAPRTTQPAALPFELDPTALPAVVEEASDSAWARFDALLHADGMEFESTHSTLHVPRNGHQWQGTRPASLPMPGKKIHIQADLDEVLSLARRANRAAPVPGSWKALYELLPHAEHDGRTYPPPPPLASEHTSPMQKRLRLRDQIEWANIAGALRPVHAFLAELPEAQWSHFGDHH